ncbi:MAG TPA: DUF1573 domain-containing protein [Chthoniobacteraceae bacterium]|nr:DUF1573 domain-containing protein [Chthoniobacteraceae bacterium]
MSVFCAKTLKKNEAAPVRLGSQRAASTPWRSAFGAVAALLALTAAAHAEIQWLKPAQDFQATPDQGKVEAHFAFKNTGTTPVTVKSITTSCGCTTATLDKKVYQPGEGGEIVAVYKFPFQHGALRKLVTVVTDDHPKEPVVLDIRVFVHEPFEVKPALVYWRTGAVADVKTVQLLADGYPVHVKSVTSSNPRITATLQTVKAGEEYAVAIKPADTAQKETAEISVLTDFPAGAPHSYTIHARIK